MKILSLWLAMLCAPLAQVFAQVTAEVVLDQEHFLMGEALPVAVRITNRSGQPLQFGTEPDWLTFAIESREDLVVVKNGDAPVAGEFKLESGQVGTRRVDLEPYFSLDRIGRYQLTATVRVKAWNTQITTKPVAFDIINGAKVWSQDFGVPSPAGATGRPPEVRRYSLEQVNYLRSQLRLYLRITASDGGRVIKVFPLGPVVSFGNPEYQVDKESCLHVLFQNGARSFSYTVVNPDGDILIRQTHDYASSRPRLVLNEAGKVVVGGGVRRVTASDIPEPKPLETDAPPKNP
jgi:hypothetical protein